jgi:hypothetical protein
VKTLEITAEAWARGRSVLTLQELVFAEACFRGHGYERVKGDSPMSSFVNRKTTKLLRYDDSARRLLERVFIHAEKVAE